MSALFNMPAGVFGQPPTARQIANIEELFAMNDQNFQYLEDLWSCGEQNEDDREILKLIAGLRACGNTKLSWDHPVAGLVQDDDLVESMKKLTGAMTDFGIIRAKALGEYERVRDSFDKEREEMERSIFARVRAEQEFASDDAPKAG
jgi:hypothetical protein